MNDAQIRKALSNHNLQQVAEATRIPPNVLQSIVAGQIPTPDEIDKLAGWFGGEYYVSGLDSNWNRKRKVPKEPEVLQMISPPMPSLPKPEYGRWADISEHPDRPKLVAGPKPTGNGAAPNSDGFTGSGVRVK